MDFEEFKTNNFDPAVKAAQLISENNSYPIEYQISLIKQKINDLVLANRLDSNLDSLATKLSETKQWISQTRKQVSHIDSKFNQRKLNDLITGISNAQKSSILFKRIQKFLVIQQRCVDLINHEKYAEAASQMSQLTLDLSHIPWLQTEYSTLIESKSKLLEAVEIKFLNGLENSDPSQIIFAIEIYSNLGILNQKIIDLLKESINQISKASIHSFDLGSLNAEMKELSKMQQIRGTNVAQWANLLWKRLETWADLVYKKSNAIYSISQVLSDLQKESLVQELENLDLVSWFWIQLAKDFDKEMKKACKGSPFLLQVLQAGYPKFLRIFNDLFLKIHHISGSDQESIHLVQVLASFESAYIGRSMTRLLEVVNQAFPDNKQKAVNVQDVEKIIRTISSELEVVKFNSALLKAIGKNVNKCVNMYSVKAENLFSTEASFSPTNSPTNDLNIAILNSLGHFLELLFKLCNEYDLDILETACSTLASQLSNLGQPILCEYIGILHKSLTKIHQDDHVQPLKRQNETSHFLSEYLVKIGWMFKDFISRLTISDAPEWATGFCNHALQQFMYHTSIVRPISDQGKLKLVANLSQVEKFISEQNLSPLVLQQCQEFKKMFFLELEQIQKHHLYNVEKTLILNHLIVRSYPAIRLPMLVESMTEMEYVDYIDSHSTEEVEAMIKKCLNEYAYDVQRRGETLYCLEYPILRNFLE